MTEPRPTAATTEATYRRADDALWRQFEGGLLLLRPALDHPASEPTLVSGIGPLLWSLLDEPRTLAQLVTAVREATGPSAPDDATVRADLATVLATLESARFVVRGHAG